MSGLKFRSFPPDLNRERWLADICKLHGIPGDRTYLDVAAKLERRGYKLQGKKNLEKTKTAP